MALVTMIINLFVYIGALLLRDTRKVNSDASRDLLSFVQIKKREKYPWRSAVFSKVAS